MITKLVILGHTSSIFELAPPMSTRQLSWVDAIFEAEQAESDSAPLSGPFCLCWFWLGVVIGSYWEIMIMIQWLWLWFWFEVLIVIFDLLTGILIMLLVWSYIASVFFKHLQSLWRSYWTHDGTSWNQRLPLFYLQKLAGRWGGWNSHGSWPVIFGPKNSIR